MLSPESILGFMLIFEVIYEKYVNRLVRITENSV